MPGKIKVPRTKTAQPENVPIGDPSQSPLLREMVDELFNITSPLQGSLYFLLPKGCDPSNISNYRPIALLNTLYKIAAKILAIIRPNSLGPFLMESN